MTVLVAELSDLRGWSRQVTRAGTDCQGLSGYLRTEVPDGDFGRILELISGDYESVSAQFVQVLGTDAQRLRRTGATLEEIVRDYAATDARVAQDFGVGKAITDDGHVASGFLDVMTVLPPPAPFADADTLPEVSFGFIFDKICDLTNWVIGIDPREYVTRWIAGDIEKAARQASAWQHVSDCLDGVERNLARGQSAIARTWQGQAATSSAAYVDQWLSSLGDQSRATARMSTHLHDLIRGAVDLAQNVVDIIRMIISICSAALSSSYIPVWGQWKVIRTIKEAWQMFKTARKAIQAFWAMVTTVKDLLISLVHGFTAESLPAAPSVPAAP